MARAGASLSPGEKEISQFAERWKLFSGIHGVPNILRDVASPILQMSLRLQNAITELTNFQRDMTVVRGKSFPSYSSSISISRGCWAFRTTGCKQARNNTRIKIVPVTSNNVPYERETDRPDNILLKWGKNPQLHSRTGYYTRSPVRAIFRPVFIIIYMSLICILLSLSSYNFIYSIIIFLIISSGLSIIFLYFSGLISNEQNEKISINWFIKIYMLISLFYLILY